MHDRKARPPIPILFARCRCCAATLGVLAAFLVSTLWPPAVAATFTGGLPPGYARIWLYRLDEPYVSLARPYVRLNGRIVGISEPGGAFYRDVRPGDYYVSVDSQGRDVNQFARVDAAAGQQIYIEVQVLRGWDCGLFDHDRCWPTFYTRLQSPQVAIAAIARGRFYGGG
jgi:hypothetical protein